MGNAPCSPGTGVDKLALGVKIFQPKEYVHESSLEKVKRKAICEIPA